MPQSAAHPPDDHCTLIAFVGTGNYVAVPFQISGLSRSEATWYASYAIASTSELPIRKAILLVTQDARNKQEKLGTESLQHALERHGITVVLQDIPDGKTEQDLWKIFNIIGACLPTGTRVIFDITNGFRSLPAIGTLALSFFSESQNVKVEKIYYGAFEALGWAKDVEAALAGEKSLTAPIFDLTPMFVLPKWGAAVSEWERTGRAQAIVEKSEVITNSIQRRNKQTTPLTKLPKAMENLGMALALTHHREIPEKARSLLKLIPQAEAENIEDPALSPLLGVLPKICASTQRLCADDELVQGLATVEWYKDHLRFAEGWALLREVLTSACVRAVRLGLAESMLGKLKLSKDGPLGGATKEQRDLAEKIVAGAAGTHDKKEEKKKKKKATSEHDEPEIPPQEKKPAVLEGQHLLKPILGACGQYYTKAIEHVIEQRNSIEHAFMGDHALKPLKNARTSAPNELAEGIEKVRLFVESLNTIVRPTSESAPYV